MRGSSLAAFGGGNSGTIAKHGTTHQRGGSDEVLSYVGQHAVSSVVETIPRWAAINETVVAGTVYVGYFTAPDDLIIQFLAACNGAVPPNTPTLIRFGLYSANAAGDITQLAVTSSDTTLFAVTNTVYRKSLTAPQAITRGQRYAIALLIVAASAGHIKAQGVSAGLLHNPPALPALQAISMTLPAQSDLPSGTTLYPALTNGTLSLWLAAST